MPPRLQDGAYGDENYQNWRKILTETCRAEVGALNPELVSVRLHRQAVEHYQMPEAFVSLTETDKGTLDERGGTAHLAGRQR